jgi:hypothetical protein
MGGGLREEEAEKFNEVRRALEAQQPVLRLERNEVPLATVYQVKRMVNSSVAVLTWRM